MDRVQKLRNFLEGYYKQHGQNLLFHGWHHIVFVTDKATELAKELNADVETVAAAALTHDLNYLVDTYSRVTEGQKLREDILSANDYTKQEIDHITSIVNHADLQNRNEKNIPIEAQILSDADTLFKALPTAPFFSGKYLQQTGIGLQQLASSITRHQAPLFEQDVYFYTKPYREKYMAWANNNILLWQHILESLEDKDIRQMLETAGVKL